MMYQELALMKTDQAQENCSGNLTQRERIMKSEGIDHDISKLIEDHIRYSEILVSRVMRAKGLHSELQDELRAAAHLGLVEAAAKFDRSKGFAFLTYASKRIRGAILDALREHSNTLGMTGNYFKVLQSVQDAEIIESEESTETKSEDHELATIFDQAARGLVAFQLITAGREHNEQPGDSIADEEQPDPEQRMLRKEFFRRIESIVASLSEKEQMVIREHYFNDMSFTEIVSKYEGISRSWISRLHARALESIKYALLANRKTNSDIELPRV